VDLLTALYEIKDARRPAAFIHPLIRRFVCLSRSNLPGVGILTHKTPSHSITVSFPKSAALSAIIVSSQNCPPWRIAE